MSRAILKNTIARPLAGCGYTGDTNLAEANIEASCWGKYL